MLEEVELIDELDDWAGETETVEDGDVFFHLKIRASQDMAGGEEVVAEAAVEEAMDDGDVVAAKTGDGGVWVAVVEPTKSLAANA